MRSTLLLLLCAFALRAQSGVATVSSPDGQITLTVRTVGKDTAAKDTVLPQGGQLVYSVTFHGKPLLENSALRLDLQGQRPLGSDVSITTATSSTIDETYRLVTGKVSQVRNHANALHIDCEETGPFARKLTIEARAYDDAVAFRYLIPDAGFSRDFRLQKEGTEFRLSKDATAYALLLPNFRSMYESEFIKMNVSAMSNQGGVASHLLVGLPLLLDVPGVGWAAIAEADVRDYSSMYLTNPSESWQGHYLEAKLSPNPDDPEIAVSGTLPKQSPWRVILIGDQPGRLIESTVLTSLNPPSKIADTSWIKAGKAAWDWWSGSVGPDNKPAYSTETMKYYVDFAAKSGLEYMVVDAGWYSKDITQMNGRVDIPALVKYAAAKNVKVWIWLHYSGVERQMDQAFPLYEKWGVAGMKIDFISRNDQAGMSFYQRVAEKAAQHHLMVDFHGSTTPSGLDRTYPNVMGYEAVLGLEQSKAGMRDNPDHHAMLPFTRMLTGRMDYTPGGFGNATRDTFEARSTRPMVQGTRAHQLAMYVAYEAPIQMVADAPQAYEGEPAFDFIKSVPATWDETRVLSGEPGEFIVIARRHGNRWFVGGLTNWTPRTLQIPLTFLNDGSYSARIYADSADAGRYPRKSAIDTKSVTKVSVLSVQLAEGGGVAIEIDPVVP